MAPFSARDLAARLCFVFAASGTARPAQNVPLRDVSDSGAEPPIRSASFPPSLRRQRHISQPLSGYVCVCVCWSLWGLIICSEKTNSSLAGLLETKSVSNVLLKTRSHSVACLCGFFHPTDNDLYVFFRGGRKSSRHARTSASAPFSVPSSRSF